MHVDSSGQRGVHFRVLTDDECERVVLAAHEVLERTGARFYDSQAVDILSAAGCVVEDGVIVRFPAAVIEEALATVPQRFDLYDRDGNLAIPVEPGRAYFGPGPTCPNFIDPHTGERRPFVKNDAALTARACDALDEIDYVMSLGSVSDYPADQADIHEFDAMLRETRKPIMSWSFSRESLDRIHRMCAEVKGSVEAFAAEPFMIHYAEPSPPLRNTPDAIHKLLYCAEHGIPIVYTPCDIGAGTAPATMAGILAQNVAECLAGVVLSQLVRKGTPIVAGGVVSVLDLHTTILCYGAPELSLLSAAATEVTRFLGLPMFSTAGCTDAKCLDEQAAVEATHTILLAALSGANFIHDVGFTESAITGSLDQLVMCDEIIGLARRIARGIRVDDETLATDAIAEAFSEGTFLALSHTVRNFREEMWFPRLLDRRRHEEWRAGGSTSMADRIRERVRGILAEHEVAPLSDELSESITRIVNKPRREQ